MPGLDFIGHELGDGVKPSNRSNPKEHFDRGKNFDSSEAEPAEAVEVRLAGLVSDTQFGLRNASWGSFSMDKLIRSSGGSVLR